MGRLLEYGVVGCVVISESVVVLEHVEVDQLVQGGAAEQGHLGYEMGRNYQGDECLG